MLDWLRAAYGAFVVDDPGVGEDMGISVVRRSGAGPRLLPYVVHGRRALLRSRSVARLMHRLDVELAKVAGPAPSGCFSVADVAAIVKDGRAALVPTDLVERSSAVERAVVATGCRIVEGAALYLDGETGDAVALRGFAAAHGIDDDGLVAEPGRYEVAALFWSEDEVREDERRATGLVRLVERVADRSDLEPTELLAACESMSRRIAPVALPGFGADLGAVVAALGAGGP